MATLVVITGASRGFGRCLAVEFARRVAPPLSVVLLARSETGLAETSAAVSEASKAAFGDSAGVPQVTRVPIDLGDVTTLEASLEAAAVAIESQAAAGPGFARSVFVNNAGSLGSLCKLGDVTDMAMLRRTVDLNVTSFLWLTSRFTRLAHSLHGSSAAGGAEEGVGAASGAGSGAGAGSDGTSAAASGAPSTIVNISSLAAVQPFATWGLYCAGKAARDMTSQVLAAEAAGSKPVLSTLNYAPGPMDTDMQGQLRSSDTVDGSIKEYMTGLKERGELVDPSDSAAKCVRVVMDGLFKSGTHVDFYDKVPGDEGYAEGTATRRTDGDPDDA